MARDPYKTDESASSLWFEQAVNATVHIGAIAYGTQLATAFLAVYYVLHSEKKKYVWQSITYVVLLVLLSTIYTACNIHSNEMAWIDERGYPGGPLEYQLEQSNTATIVVANVAAITITFLADSCMVSTHLVAALEVLHPVPGPMDSRRFSSLASSLLNHHGRISRASASYRGRLSGNLALSIAFTLLVTLMIVARVLLMHRRIQVTLGPEYGRAYTGIAAMLIECALPYALISFVFIILYGLGSTASNLFVPLMIMVEAMTPQLIIIRVVRGRGKNVHAMNIAGSLSDSSFEELSKAVSALEIRDT
ncbi:hypothetical protein EV421DRAFT_1738388 [Armillaria borealis]|uniref:Uncharacterized protein n=1 Tax=Armillaria borealis TaxID=47425 RepID=A0AA39MM08_9AGAR|nr:hypothetical protein EV421DRAFT_1738388 [Armillaria borealis]